MTHVATLISNPAAPALDAVALDRARMALPGAGQPNWLDPGIAADIPFTPAGANDQRGLADLIRELFVFYREPAGPESEPVPATE